MLQWILDEWQGVKFNKFIAFCELASLAVQILLKLSNFLLGKGGLSLQIGVDRVNEEVYPEVKFQFGIGSQQIEY